MIFVGSVWTNLQCPRPETQTDHPNSPNPFYFLQPDELYFEEGDILYISDTVSLVLPKISIFFASNRFLQVCLCLSFIQLWVIYFLFLRVTLIGGRGRAGEGLVWFQVTMVRRPADSTFRSCTLKLGLKVEVLFYKKRACCSLCKWFYFYKVLKAAWTS